MGTKLKIIVAAVRIIIWVLWLVGSRHANPNDWAVHGVGLRPFACWDCWFESHREHGYLSFVDVVLSGKGRYNGLITHSEESY